MQASEPAPKPRPLAVVAAGRAASALAAAARAAGWPVLGAWSRSAASAERFSQMLATPPHPDPARLCRDAAVVVLGASDDAIEPLCRRLAAERAFRPGQAVLHLSGARSSAALAAARESGAAVAACHPLMTFPAPAAPGVAPSLRGVAFAIEGDPDAVAAATDLARSVGGRPLVVSAEARPLYHAAAMTLSAGLVALHELAARLFAAAGIDPDAALAAAGPLVDETLANIRRTGREAALTGPVARGDLGTVRSHLAALSDRAPDLQAAYLALARLAADVARRRGACTDEAARELDRLLAREVP